MPANEIMGLAPGEVFVHRNVANLVVNTDLNVHTVIEYAVRFLEVEHIIVCGHYGCGGVRAAMQQQELGLIDHWLRHIRDVHHRHHDELDCLPTEERRLNRLCELNVLEQVNHVCETSIVQNAWERGQELSVHGWIYSINDGHLRDLHLTINNQEQVNPHYRVYPAEQTVELRRKEG